MKILVTGGLGFIGSHLVPQLLANGHSVFVFDNLSSQIHGAVPYLDQPWLKNPGVNIVRGDVVEAKALTAAVQDIDAIVHLAAETGTGQSMYRIAHYNAVNSQGTAVLLQALMERRERPISRFVLASSRSVYGEGAYICSACSDQKLQFPSSRSAHALAASKWDPECVKCGTELVSVPTPETAATHPASIYAATKLAQEDLVRIFSESTGTAAVALRFQNVYGEGQSLNNPYTGILSIFSTRIRRNLSLPIFEDGLESRDFVHVDDIARAVAAAIDAPLSGYNVFNVGSGVPTSVIELAQKLAERLGYQGAPEVTAQYRLGDIRHCYADMTRIAEVLNFRPTVSVDEGLDRFVNWVLTQELPEDGLSTAERELRRFGLMGGKSSA